MPVRIGPCQVASVKCSQHPSPIREPTSSTNWPVRPRTPDEISIFPFCSAYDARHVAHGAVGPPVHPPLPSGHALLRQDACAACRHRHGNDPPTNQVASHLGSPGLCRQVSTAALSNIPSGRTQEATVSPQPFGESAGPVNPALGSGNPGQAGRLAFRKGLHLVISSTIQCRVNRTT